MLSHALNLALIGPLGHWELLIILVLGLLIFGRRLPEVGRSLGKGIVEFKRGIKDIGDEIEDESSKPPTPANRAAVAGNGGTLPEGAAAGGTTFKAPTNAEGEDARVAREQSTENRE
jgi:sec-independent protein translocase protein TatA